MTDVSVKTLRSKVDQFLTLKNRIREQEGYIKELNEELKPVIDELNSLMEAMEIDRFEGSLGKINRVVTTYVNTPQTDEDKTKFFDYLRGEGIFEEMASVNYMKLNSFFKDKLEMAIEAGEALTIPGLEPKQRVEIRKGR